MKRDALVREAHHRSTNDLHMVVSLLNIMARRAADVGQADVLLEASNKVRLLARARAGLLDGSRHSLSSSLRDVCEALQIMAEPRGVAVSLSLDREPDHLDAEAVMEISMAVNELATNAVKHAYAEGAGGSVRIALRQTPDGRCAITVEDDGSPMMAAAVDGDVQPGGTGLQLVPRLLERHGRLILPDSGAKRFEIVLDPAGSVQMN